MPEGFHEKTAISLNHAFTMLSQKFESHRISNTGNVYDRFFYKESNGHWFPLDDLRRGAQSQTERALISDLWRQVEEELGWRPLAAPKGKKRRNAAEMVVSAGSCPSFLKMQGTNRCLAPSSRLTVPHVCGLPAFASQAHHDGYGFAAGAVVRNHAPCHAQGLGRQAER